MQFQVGALLTALVATVAADRIEVFSNCGPFGCNRSSATWYNDHDQQFYVNGNDGCRDPDVPGVYQVCFDWGKDRKRGHFYADGQGKRCFRQYSEFQHTYCGTGECYTTWFTESPCNWREATPEEGVGRVTAAGDVSSTAEAAKVTTSAFKA